MLEIRNRDGVKQWLDSITGKPRLAIVLGGSVNGLSFVRSLGRRGVPTLLVSTEMTAGVYTRFGEKMLLPDPDEGTEEWATFFDLVRQHVASPPVVFPTSDAHCMMLAELPESLAQYYRFLVPNAESTRSIVDKRLQYSIAIAAGVPIPKTFFPECVEDVSRISKEMTYPCILKPYESRRRRKRMSGKVAFIESADQLLSEYERLTALDVKVMAQEIIPGKDSSLFGYLALWDRDGREGGWLTKRKLRQSSQFGDGSLQVTVEEPRVVELSRRLLAAFKYRGFVGVEFRYDERDDSFRLMEINARTVSGNQLPISAGMDFPWLGYDHLANDNPDAGRSCVFERDVVYVHEEWDFGAYRRLRGTGELSFVDWAGSMWNAKAKALGAWDDPMPLLVTLWRMVRGGVRQLSGISPLERQRDGRH
jgi:D-aspartate ligase